MRWHAPLDAAATSGRGGLYQQLAYSDATIERLAVQDPRVPHLRTVHWLRERPVSEWGLYVAYPLPDSVGFAKGREDSAHPNWN